MTNDESQQAREDLAKSVAEQLDAGKSKQDIIKSLTGAGLNSFEAEQFVDHIERLRYEVRKEAYKRAGTKDLGCGFLLLLIGAGITYGTWAAAGPGGGYWVMWGAIVVGAFYILLSGKMK